DSFGINMDDGTVDTGKGVEQKVPGSAEATGTVIDYRPVQTGEKSFAVAMDYEEGRDTRSIYEKLADFGQAALSRATDPEGQKAYIQGQLDKIIGIGEGLNIAKESTKAAVVAGWNALTDGTVANFLAKPNAINDPLFHAVGGALDAMAKDPNAVNHALERVGTIIMDASERYTAAPNREKGHVIAETMFAMVNPEGSTEAGEAALKIADKVATHVDAAVMQRLGRSYRAVEEMAAATPELAQQAKQMLYDYTSKLGLSPQEMELAGIPKGYFDGIENIAAAAENPLDDYVMKMSPWYETGNKRPISAAKAAERAGVSKAELTKLTPEELQAAGLEFVPKPYEKTFFDAHPELVDFDLEVHHAIPQAVLERYPTLFTANEVNSLEFLRGIPNEATINGERVHKLITGSWNKFLKQNTNATREQVLNHLQELDNTYGAHFTPPINR
ncbi:MAG TPA: hypothetical protein V6D08_03845, partial [Candidatus Obscuribacterales bacterium]